ncbi:MAG TPA: nucleoside hydrolase [Flavitalea sp.]|nr:nucleoside hydrolase [Flavitalea sp.]
MNLRLPVAFAITVFLITCCKNPEPAKPVVSAVIFDTDMGPDYDDVGAITMLHAFADEGSAEILATIASTKYDGVAEVLDVFNTYFNRPDVPVGVPSQNASRLRDFQHWSDSVRKNYPHSINGNNEAEDAVALYRKILASQPDTSVTIITVGFLTNIANLLKSSADKYSPLTGKELAGKKVKKLVSMAGKFPEGSEFNIKIDAPASQYVFENFSRPVIFSGFEIGEKIKAGIALISNSSIKNSPVKDVFRICIPLAKEDSAGRMSWDETAVLVGVKGHEPYYTLEEGKITIDTAGYNKWETTEKKHAHLVEKSSSRQVEEVINTLIMHQPVKK